VNGVEFSVNGGFLDKGCQVDGFYDNNDNLITMTTIYSLLLFTNEYMMSKRLSKNIDSFEDYRLLAIVSHVKDYTLCYHINNNLRLDLVKYEDFNITQSEDVENNFSWYYFNDKISRTAYYLMSNKNEKGNLIASHKTVDYFLLIKDSMSDEVIIETIKSLRNTPNINAVFDIKMQQTKNVDILLESIELHELQFVRKRPDKGILI